MLITKQIQNQPFKKSKTAHGSFLLKQISLSKMKMKQIQNVVGSSVKHKQKQKFKFKQFFSSSQQNTMRTKSANYKKKHCYHHSQLKKQTRSMRPTTCNTLQTRKKQSKTIFSTLESQQKLKKLQAKINKNNYSEIEYQQKTLQYKLYLDQMEKRKINKKLNQIVNIAKKGNIIKKQFINQNQNQKQKQNQNIDHNSNLQNSFINSKLKQLYLSNKLSQKAYQYVKGFNCLLKRGRRNRTNIKSNQQVSYSNCQTNINCQSYIQNQNAKQLQKICIGGYPDPYQDLTQYLTIQKFNQSRQKFTSLQQFYNKVKYQYKLLKYQKIYGNTNDIQPLQKSLISGSIMSVVYANQLGQRMNKTKRKKFYQINNFV